MMGRLFKSKFAAVIGTGLLLLTIFYLARQIYKKRQIDAIVAGLEAEISKVEGKNKDMLELINYYKTSSYKEKQARSLLGLQKEGEFVVALPKNQDNAEGEVKPADQKSNLKKWWEYFFGN